MMKLLSSSLYPLTQDNITHFYSMDWSQVSPCDLPHYEQKHENRDRASYTVPMLWLPVVALRLIASIALSSRLVIKNGLDLKGNKKNILIENEFALNMKDIFMVKAINSCATKSGHFYLLLTAAKKVLTAFLTPQKQKKELKAVA